MTEEHIEKWKARVGEDVAAGISRQASDKGNQLHAVMEKYVLNEEICLTDLSYVVQGLFKQIKKILDPNLGLVHGVESTLYSDSLGVAGSTDLIGIWRGEPAVIDYKTSAFKKDVSKIKHYIYQAMTYGLMTEEMRDFSPTRLVILFGHTREDDGAEFVFPVTKSLKREVKEFLEIRVNEFQIKG